MKKVFLLLVAVFSFAIVVTSCKETKKDSEKSEMHENHDANHKEGEDHKMAEATYACPMDCEDGKTYAEAGSCPECKMDLKLKSKHAENCKCQEGGECKCEDGKCECQNETASAEKECKMCEPGSCKCKA